MKPKQCMWFVLLAAQSILWGGCVSPAVWQEGQFARYHEPAQQANVRLFYSSQGQDVLVEYVECRESDESLRPRAFWLEQNVERLQERRRPHFVPLQEAQDLMPIPVVEGPGVPVPPPAQDLWALVLTNGCAFALYAGEQERGSYPLPVYRDASGRIKQVLLTPPAVVADVTIVGALIVYYTAPGWWPAMNGVVR